VDAIREVMEVVDAAGSGELYRRELCAVRLNHYNE